MNELEPLIAAAPEDLRRYIRQLEERVHDLERICRATGELSTKKRATQARYRERRRK